MNTRNWIVVAGLLLASVCYLFVLIVLPPRGIGFLVSYLSLEDGMSRAEVLDVMSRFERADDLHFLLGIPAPPDGGIWRCDLGPQRNMNLVRVRFAGGRLVEKEISWD